MCRGPVSPQVTKTILGLFRRGQFCFSAYCAAGDFVFTACFFAAQAIFFRLEKVFCVLISSSTLYLGLASSFGVGYFTSYYESSTETAAVFLCLRTKQASSPAARNGRGNP